MNNNQYQNVNQYMSEQPNTNNQNNIIEPKNHNKVLIIILLLLVLVLTGIILYMQFGKKEETPVIDDPPVITLKGESKITITEGDDYVENGFSAKSYNGEDLTSKVEIKNNVNVKVPGTYEIVYTVIDSNQKLATVKRTIIVEDLTLKLQLLGETTTNILKGSKYVESGYEANDLKDGNLNAKVNITGAVDSNVLGVYKIKYVINNSANKTVTKERIINVVSKKGDFAIELLASNNNQKAIITMNIIGDDYSYALMPNGRKVTTKTAFYEVSTSSNYEFKVYDIYGNEYIKEIAVNLKPDQLELNSKQVLELYDYIASLVGKYKNFYQTIKVTSENASKESLLEGAYISLGKSEPTNEELQTQARKIYNLADTTNIPTKILLQGEGTDVHYEDQKWKLEGSTINGHQNGTLVKAEKNGNYIYLYDNYKFVDYMNVNKNALANTEFAKVYSGSDKKLLTGNVTCKVANCGFTIGFHDENNTTNINATDTLYRHTFKLNADGTYFWVSSEPENNVNVESELIKKLYNYVSSSASNYRNFYQTTKVTKSNATKEALLEGAYISLGKSELTNEELQMQTKKIYNLSGTAIIPTTTKLTNVKYENGKWVGSIGKTHQNGILIKALKNGNNLYLYDEYQFIDFTNLNSNVAVNSELAKVYSGSDKKVLAGSVNCTINNCSFANLGSVNSNDKVTIEAAKTLYIHTFKMNSDGDYYWVSSEQVK